MSDHHARFSPALVETIAGLSAGGASTLVVHPLDVIKTRLQIHRSTSASPLRSYTVFQSLVQTEKPIQTLYRGLTPNLIGNASSWALFFYFKSIIETQLRQFHSRPGLTPLGSLHTSNDVQTARYSLSPSDYFASSFLSGILISLSTNPIWVLKTRMLSTNASAHGAYPSMWAGARSVWQNEGFRGFYRGVGAGMLGVSHGAVQFAVYEPLKGAWRRYLARRLPVDSLLVEEEKMGNTATLVISGAAKIFAGTSTYPLQVVRSRLQTYDADVRFGRGIRGVVARVWAEEGWRGFYRGVGPNVIRVLPSTWVTFLVYENVRYYLPRTA